MKEVAYELFLEEQSKISIHWEVGGWQGERQGTEVWVAPRTNGWGYQVNLQVFLEGVGSHLCPKFVIHEGSGESIVSRILSMFFILMGIQMLPPHFYSYYFNIKVLIFATKVCIRFQVFHYMAVLQFCLASWNSLSSSTEATKNVKGSKVYHPKICHLSMRIILSFKAIKTQQFRKRFLPSS